MVDRDHEIPADKRMHLQRLQVLQVGLCGECVGHNKQVTRVLLNLRPLLALQSVFHRERMEFKLLQQEVGFVRSGIGDIEPDSRPRIFKVLTDLRRRKIPLDRCPANASRHTQPRLFTTRGNI